MASEKFDGDKAIAIALTAASFWGIYAAFDAYVPEVDPLLATTGTMGLLAFVGMLIFPNASARAFDDIAKFFGSDSK